MGTENKARRLWLEVEVGPKAEGVHDELRHLANALANYDHVTGVSFGEETVGFGEDEPDSGHVKFSIGDSLSRNLETVLRLSRRFEREHAEAAKRLAADRAGYSGTTRGVQHYTLDIKGAPTIPDGEYVLVPKGTPTASDRLREWANLACIGHGRGAIHLNPHGVEALQYAADELDALDKPDDEPEPEFRWGGESLLGTWTCRLGDREVGSVLIRGDGRFSAGKQVGSLRHEYGCFATLDLAKAAVEKAARGVTP